MSTSKIMRAMQNLFKQIRRMAHSLTKGFISWLLRGLLVVGGRPFASIAGFVLPTTVLLLLVVVLTVGAIGYRTYTRSQQAIGERQQRVIYNAATPAIDRAKAKLEFMFNQNRDPRYGGVPSEDQLMGMMLNDDSNGVPRYPATGPDPYTFPGETRINIGGSGTTANKKDNAWRYRADMNGDGTEDATVVYSIVFDAPESTQAGVQLRDSTDTALASRASQLLIRNSPLSNAASSNAGCVRGLASSGNAPLISERGWFDDPVDSTKLRKNFQVDAYVVPDTGNTIATLEFQQDREAIQGFKWAAWFRNDLEIFPGPRFNWNGAMHTEGSYFVSSDTFRAYMVSAPNSCIYKEDASTLTTPFTTYAANTIPPAYQGQFVAGSLRDNRFESSGPRFDLWRGEGQLPQQDVEMDQDTDSITNRANQGPLDISLDPYVLHTQDKSQGRTVLNPADRRDTTWATNNPRLANRMQNQPLPTPYLDDTFRADNRYGPKPKFGYSRSDIPGRIGDPIVGNLELIGNEPQAGQESSNVGLDGYWERRAQSEGARFIVGQRLELGNPSGWGGPLANETNVSGDEANDLRDRLRKEPLRPWPETCIGNDCNQLRQRKASWDNLAAVQATAVYHSASPDGKQFPAACMVTTVHPGTATTLDKSATFENLAFGFESAFGGDYNAPGRVITDFLRGRGTNGWEYSIPAEAEFRNTSSNLMIGLKNLAYFAGDPSGGAPSFTPVQNQYPHPYPSMSMWGDFSMLRRVLALMDSGTQYDLLSPADKTTLHTSACMLGMLAYNVDYLSKLNLASVPAAVIGTANGAPATTTYWDGLRGHIRAIDALIYDTDRNTGSDLDQLNNNDANQTTDPFRIPATLRSTIPGEIGNIQPDDMHVMAWIEGNLSRFNNDPETYVRFLEFWRDSLADTNALKAQLTQEIYLAQMVISKEQVARDRKWGFEGSYGGVGTSDALSDQCLAWYQAPGVTPGGDQYRLAAQAEPLMRLCSNRPRYPVLYSLFPLTAHGDVTDVATKARDSEDNQGRNYTYLRLVNRAITYNVVDPATIRTVPLQLSGTQIGYDPSLGGRAWRVPVQAHSTATGSTPNSNQFNLIKVCNPAGSGTWQDAACSRQTSLTNRTPVNGNLYRLAFRDSAFMNGREQLSVRTLDLDLDMMRQSSVFGDYWLPRTGIIYAFREDATSEAQIVRPAAASLSQCDSETDLRTSARCQMKTGQRVAAEDATDPPLSDLGISPKPVDYFPDPDRRPNGFRLRNGAALWRGSLSGGQINDDANPKGRGLSFITDNPAYVQGYFNLHRDAGQTSLARADGIEEFQQKLNTADFDNNSGNLYAFYNRTDLNLNFADMRYDQWRPAELIADAVTPLSTNFCDGSLEDGLLTVTNDNAVPGGATFVTNRYGCQGTPAGRTSYLNQNRRNAGLGNNAMQRGGLVDSYWRARLGSSARVFTGDKDSGNTPVFVYRSGRPVRVNSAGNLTEYDGGYSTTDSNKPLISAPSGIQMNLITVSGVVPSREGQSYGGLHNFPRFIENWGNQEFFIAGAFLQLNFSTYATAPFDQEQWEPTLSEPNRGAGNNEWISYYSPPLRRWGFDVGLKYAAPGPVAARFRTADPNRSEFYSEPPANDPYIQNLIRCAAPGSCPGT